MKRIFYLILLCVLLPVGSVKAQTGCLGFGNIQLNVTTTQICPADSDTLFLTSLPDTGNFYWYALNSANWTQNNLGGTTTPQDIERGSDGTIFGLFFSSGYKVYELNNGVWGNATNSLPSSEQAVSFAIGANNQLYVATVHNTTNRASVWEWSANSWSAVGSQNFTPNLTSFSVEKFDLEVDGSGDLLLAFVNDSAFDFASVMKYAGTSWSYLGFIQASTTVASQVDLEITSGNVPHLAVMRNGSGAQIEVQRYVSSWSSLGTNLTFDYSEELDLEMIGTTPFLAYEKSFGQKQVKVKSFDGTSWSDVGVFNGSVQGEQPELESYLGQPVLCYKKNGSNPTAFATWTGSSWDDYMIDFTVNSQVTTMRLDAKGWPVLKSGAGFYQYSATHFNASLQDTSQIITNPGQYAVVSADTCGNCTMGNIVKVDILPVPNYSFAVDLVHCQGDSNGAIQTNLTGSEPILSYAWNNGAISPGIDSLPGGTYYVTITGNNCILVDSVILIDPSPLSNTFSVTDESCTNQEDGIIVPNTLGGRPPFSYFINGLVSNASQLENLGSGSYTIHTRDAYSCLRTDIVTVGTTTSFAPPQITQGDSATICQDSLQLSATTNFTNYNWFKINNTPWQLNNVDAVEYEGTSQNLNIVMDNSGQLVLGAANGSTGVRRRVNGTWQNLGLFTGAGYYTGIEYCASTLVHSRFNLNFLVYTLQDDSTNWQILPPTGYHSGQLKDHDFDYHNGLLYTMISGDFSGNQDSTFLIMHDPATDSWIERTEFRFSGNTEACELENGHDGFSYGVGIETSGNLLLKQFDGTSWTSLDSGSLNVHDEIFDFKILSDQRKLLAYRKNGTDSCFLMELVAGNWQQLGAFERSNIAQVAVQAPSLDQIYLGFSSGFSSTIRLHRLEGGNWSSYQPINTIANFAFNVDKSGNIYLLKRGNSVIDLYENKPQLISTTAAPFISQKGQYRLIADGAGCSGISSPLYGLPKLLFQLDTLQEVSCNGNSDGSAIVNLISDSGVPPFTYLWSNGTTNDSLTGVAGGIYTLSITDVDNCTTVKSISIYEPDTLAITQIATGAPNCFEGLDGWADADVIGGRMPYTYSWPLFADMSADSVLLPSGDYQVTVTDPMGCSDSTQFTVPISGSAVAPIQVTPGNASMCGVDSLLLTAQTTASQFQWYSMDTGSWELVGGVDYRQVGSSSFTNQVDVEANTAGNYYVANASGSFSGGVNEVRIFDGISWRDLGSQFTNGNQVRNMKMVLDSNEAPVVAFIRDVGTIDSLFVRQWNGVGWQTLYSASGTTFTDLDLEKDAITNHLYLASTSNANGIQLLQFHNNMVDTLQGGSIGTAPFIHVDIDQVQNGSWYVLGTTTSLGEAYHFDGSSLTAISLIGLTGWDARTEFEAAEDSTVYIRTFNGVYTKQSNQWVELGNWNNLGQAVDLELSPEGIPYLDRSGLVYWFDGNDWKSIPTNSPGYTSPSVDLQFLPDGRPVAVKVNVFNGASAKVHLFQPQVIASATSSQYTVHEKSYLMVAATEGTCTKYQTTAVNGPSISTDKNQHIFCPGDSIQLDPVPIGLNGPLSFLWNTGDTSQILSNATAGVYTVTITGVGCSFSDSIVLTENPAIQVSLDSIRHVTCHGGTDGYLDISAASTAPYSLVWSDLGTSNIETRVNMPPGNYSVIAQITGCNNTDSLSMTLTEPAPVNVPTVTTTLNQSICDLDSVLLDVQPDTSVSIQWMSFDSIQWEHKIGNAGTSSSGAYGNKGGELYMGGSGPSGNSGLFIFNEARWDNVWEDTVSGGLTSLAKDSNENFLIATIRGSFSNRYLRVVRVGQDTTVLMNVPTNGDKAYWPNIENVNGTPTFAYLTEHPTWSGQASLIIVQYNGTTWDTVPGIPNDIIDPDVRLKTEVDNSGQLWLCYFEAQRVQIYRYDGTTFHNEHDMNTGFSTTPSPTIHTTPDGTFWFLTDYYFNFSNQGEHIMYYQGGQWDTITARHPEMSSYSFDHFDISQDPFGNLLLREGTKFYVLKAGAWERIPGEVQLAPYQSFIERDCGFPLTTYSYNWVYIPTPQTFVSSSSSTYTTQPGIYQPVAEKNGCYTYGACPVLLESGFSIQSDIVNPVACGGDTNGVIQFNIVGAASTAGFQFLWNTGDTTQQIDSLGAGTYAVTITDAGGCSKVDSIVLNPPPPIQVQLVQLVPNDCGGNPIGSIEIAASGGAGQLGVVWSNADTTFLISGLVEDTYTATVSDTNGCSVDSSFTITPSDTTAPTVNAQPTNLLLDASGQVILTPGDLDPALFDNCGIASTVLSQDTFTCADTLPVMVVMTVTDSSGNVTIDSALVTTLDPLLPSAQAINLTTVYLDSTGQAVLLPASIDSGSFDNCGIASMALSVDSFDCTDLGLASSWFIVTDPFGNADSVLLSFTVADTLAPTLNTTPVTLYLDQTGQAFVDTANLSNLAVDNCQTDSSWVSQTSFDCSETGVNTIWLYAVDTLNNLDSSQWSITVLDTLVPTAIPFSGVTIYLDSSGVGTLTSLMVDSASTDNCGIDSIYVNFDTLTCANLGTVTATFAATDSSGGSDTANFVLTVLDTLPPTLNTQTATVYLDGNGMGSLAVAQVNNGTTDNCGLQSMNVSQTTFDCSDVGTVSTWFIATDNSGNIDSVQVSVQVLDTLFPTVLVQTTDTVYLDGSGNATVQAIDYDLGSTDNCGTPIFTLSPNQFGCNDIGQNNLVLNVSDQGGNTTAIPFTIWVFDTITPTVSCFGDTTVCEGPFSFDNLAYSDNCTPTLTQLSGQPSGSNLTVGDYTYSFEVTDGSGNLAACSFEVEVVPGPSVNLGPDTAIGNGQSITFQAGTGNLTYLWSTGATTASVTVTPTASTTLGVTVTNSEGCTATDEVLIQVNPIGIFNYNSFADYGVKLYPNPTSGRFGISFEKQLNEACDIYIRNKEGQIVQQKSVYQENEVVFDLSTVAQGIYSVELRASGKRQIWQLVVL